MRPADTSLPQGGNAAPVGRAQRRVADETPQPEASPEPAPPATTPNRGGECLRAPPPRALCGTSHAVVSLELVAPADERVDRRRRCRRARSVTPIGRSRWSKQVREVLGDEIVPTDRGLGGDPPDPVPEVCVDGVQRRGSGLTGRHRVLRAVEEQVLDLRRSGAGAPGRRESDPRAPTAGQADAAVRSTQEDRARPRRSRTSCTAKSQSESSSVRSARPGSGQLHMTDRWMVRNQLNGCPRQVRHDVIVARRCPFRLRLSGKSSPTPTRGTGGRRIAYSPLWLAVVPLIERFWHRSAWVLPS